MNGDDMIKIGDKFHFGLGLINTQHPFGLIKLNIFTNNITYGKFFL